MSSGARADGGARLPSLQGRGWDLSRYYPRALDTEHAVAVLNAAAARNRDACRRGGLADMLAAYEHFWSEPTSVLTIAEVARETDDSVTVEQHFLSVNAAAQEARASYIELARGLALASSDRSASAPAELSAFLQQLQRERDHLPATSAAEWAVVAQTHGFDALADAQRCYLRRHFHEPIGDGDRVSTVRVDNFRALLSHTSPDVRRQAWAARARFAREHREVLTTLRHARGSFVSEKARLSAYSDPLQAELESFRVSRHVVAAFEQNAARIRRLADDYYCWKRHELGLAHFAACDITAPLPGFSADDLSLDNLLSCFHEATLTARPRYWDIVREVVASGTVLTDPGASTSAGWFMSPNCGQGPPLVHVPYHHNLECFAAAAHELGHACHLTDVRRRCGTIAASDRSLVFVETFALWLEVETLHAALRAATTRAARQCWRAALIEQGLHFLRTLASTALFDVERFRAAPTAGAWLAAQRALTPDWLELAEDEGDVWLLDAHADDAPFLGFGYAAAFALACAMHLRGEPARIGRFIQHTPWSLVPDVARAELDFDLENAASFAEVVGYLETLLAQLRGGEVGRSAC